MSIYNHEKKYIFIHVPRTAGTSIAEHVGGLGHQPIRYYKEFIEDVPGIEWKDIFKFAFVRHPLDRLVSAYFAKDEPQTFQDFVLDINKRGFQNIHTYPMSYFLCDNGKLEVDWIGRYENLEQDWSFLCKGLEIERPELQHIHRTHCEPWPNYYTNQLDQIARKLYRKDFELFYPDELKYIK
jgi:hypothetical protein